MTEIPRISKAEDLISILEKQKLLGINKKLLVGLDYDGTLVPFAPRPEQAVPGLRVLEVLDRLVGRSDVVIAIVSGRTMAELKRFIPLQPVWLSALHGAVIRPPGKRPEWLLDPECYNLIKEQIGNITRILYYDNYLPQGFRVENKGLSVAVHFRGVPEDQVREGLKQLLPGIDSLIDKSLFELLPGEQVVEIRPQNVNKGKAIRFIADSNQDCFPVYLGDDITDEDAFKAIGENGFTVRISSEDRPTAARWRLSQPGDALDFLDNLVGVMDRINTSKNQGDRY